MTNPLDQVTRRTTDPVRSLTAEDLQIGAAAAIPEHASSRPDDPSIDSNDPRLAEVRSLVKRFGGVVLTGPPGTSKSWYAAKIGSALTDTDETRIRYVQFHPSYQYEDFIQGFVPREDGSGFDLKDKTFIEICTAAHDDSENLYILVIDELSRGDPGRIFGEALTYIERSKRGLTFTLASGTACSVPDNLFIIATMNPFDKGVDEVDAAFERRFAKISMDPDADILEGVLEKNLVDPTLSRRIIGFFRYINSLATRIPQAAVGHTFFIDVRDEDSLAEVWRYQLRFLVERAFRLDPELQKEVAGAWQRVFRSPVEEIIESQVDTVSDPEQQDNA